jgi:outer membrane lipoprotein-sorting protein
VNEKPTPDDVLARAEAALRRLAMPEAPAEETIARAMAALHAAAGRHEVILRRRKTMRVILSVAAAVLMAAGGLCYFGGVHPGGASVAFADVAQKLRDAHTLAYQMTVQAPQLKAAMTMQVFLKEPGWMRMEAPGGVVSIGRTEAGKSQTLGLDPRTKTAMLLVQKEPKQPSGQMDPMEMVQRLRQLAEKHAEPSGKRRFGAVEAQGFRVQEGNLEWHIWVDPKTRLPIQAEFT